MVVMVRLSYAVLAAHENCTLRIWPSLGFPPGGYGPGMRPKGSDVGASGP